MVILPRYGPTRIQTWFWYRPYMEIDFQGYNFLKNFFYFQNFFQKKESIKNIFFIFTDLQKSIGDTGVYRTPKQSSTMVILPRYGPTRIQTWFWYRPYMEIDFQGYNFLKNFFYFQNFFQKKESIKNIFFIFTDLQKSREDTETQRTPKQPTAMVILRRYGPAQTYTK